MEKCIIKLLKMNDTLGQSRQAEMPYSQHYREKLRVWQALLSFITLLDSNIYTPEFR